MLVLLKAIAGPHAGQNIPLRAGQTAQIGRTEWADFAFSNDGQMSGVHFALECDENGCRFRDLGSTNGVFHNGKKVARAMLSDGDEIRAGQTTFSVRIEGAPAPVPAAGKAETAVEIPTTATLPAADAAPPEPPAVPVAASSPTVPADAARPYKAALADEDPTVRREAMLAAARSGQRWLLDYCRALCDRPAPEHWDAILLTAILGGPEDLERMLEVGWTEALGPRRFRALGAYGHPGVVKLLLDAIGGDDPPTAIAAAAAFVRMTDAEVDSDRAIELPPEEGPGPEPFDEDSPGEASLPSPERARSHWSEVKSRFAHSTRIGCGLDLGREVDEEVLAQLDLRTGWEARLRGRYRR